MIKERQHTSIKELYGAGTPKKAIARLLGIDIKTVRRQLKKTDWAAYQRDNSDYNNLLDKEQEWLISRMKEVGYNAIVLLRELKLKGYKGSYETVKRFVYPFREKQSKACVRFETGPGEQSQVDWGSAWVWLGDREVKIHFFGLVLGYSRRLYAKGYRDERFASLIDGHEEAFRWFGGFTSELLYDNAKTMITTHNVQTKELILNRQFEDFTNHYGFVAKFCTPYRPQTKGKIESGVKYLKRNFLPGRRFRDLEHLNQELEKWIVEVADARIHGTTHERPIDRFVTESLVPLKHVPPYQYIPAIGRKVSQDSLVSYGNNRYSVPWIYVGHCVDLKIMAGQLLISSAGAVIATHDLLAGKHQQSVLQTHYAGLSALKPRSKVINRPQHDPYWEEEEIVAVHDLSIYEDAAFSDYASATVH
jgi:transposase